MLDTYLRHGKTEAVNPFEPFPRTQTFNLNPSPSSSPPLHKNREWPNIHVPGIPEISGAAGYSSESSAA